MKFDETNVISTAVISFSTVIGLMTGLYFSMKTLNTQTVYIILIESLFILSITIFILWIKRRTYAEI